MKFQMAEMTPAEAARFLRQMCELTNRGSGNWDNMEKIFEQFIQSALDHGKATTQPAPDVDMLAALQGARTIIDTVLWPADLSGDAKAAFMRRYEAINDAIAKAESTKSQEQSAEPIALT